MPRPARLVSPLRIKPYRIISSCLPARRRAEPRTLERRSSRLDFQESRSRPIRNWAERLASRLRVASIRRDKAELLSTFPRIKLDNRLFLTAFCSTRSERFDCSKPQRLKIQDKPEFRSQTTRTTSKGLQRFNLETFKTNPVKLIFCRCSSVR